MAANWEQNAFRWVHSYEKYTNRVSFEITLTDKQAVNASGQGYWTNDIEKDKR